MRTSIAIVFGVLLVQMVALGGHETRGHPENELLARPAVCVSVGPEGADITGSDHRALQAAVDYVGNLGGGVVEVKPGVYLMRDSLHLRSRVTVRGAGERTVLKKAASVRSLLAADGDYGEEAITLQNPEGFEIGCGVHVASKRVSGFHTICATLVNREGPYFTLSRPINADCMMADEAYAATVFPVISAYHVQDFAIEEVTIDGNRAENPDRINGCRGAGIFFYQGDGGAIRNCVVRKYNGDGISFQQSHDVQVLGCTATGNAGGGFHPGSGSQRAVFRNCRGVGNDDNGFFFCWRVRHGVVEDCDFRENGAVGMSIGHKDSDNVIRRCVIAGNANGGVHWRDEAEPMAAHRITFEENTVEDNGGFGLFIDGATLGTSIVGNMIRDTGAGRQSVGIRISEKVGDVVLKDNVIKAEKKVEDKRSSRGR